MKKEADTSNEFYNITYRNKDGKPELDFETDEFDIRMPEIHSEETKTRGRKKSFPGPQRTDHTIPEMDYSLRVSDKKDE